MRSGASAETAGAGGATVRLRGVQVRVGTVAALRDVDLDLPIDLRTVVIGPNGAGKSTLLQVLHGLLAPSAGTIDVVGGAAHASLRFALLFQRPVMLRRSALGNVEHALRVAGVPPAERASRALQALDAVGLAFAAERPARRLSGGEQQRLALARAEALRPDGLLLDEPTSSLDPAAGAAIERHLLARSERGNGFVLTTHDLGQARRLAQRIVLMHRGRVVEQGEASVFFAAPRTRLAERFLAGEWLE